MAKIRVIHACSLLLLVIINYTEARPIKSLLCSVDFEPGKGTGSQKTEHKDLRPQPPPLEHSPSVQNSVARKPNQSIGFHDSAAVHEDAFRPTTPGSSPGVGHSSAPTKGDIKT